jgi:hypothetical protein
MNSEKESVANAEFGMRISAKNPDRMNKMTGFSLAESS